MSQEIAVIGLDLGKNVLQVHAIDISGNRIIRRQLRRAEVMKFSPRLNRA